MTFTEVQRGACLTVVRAPEAWSRWGDVERQHGAEVLTGLVAAGVLEPWDRPDYRAVTLTPWGAALLGVVIEEVWRPAVEEREVRDEARPVAPPEVVRESVMLEIPVWREANRAPRSVTLPAFARIGTSLAAPELVEAPTWPEPEPEYLRDDEGQPVKLFPLSLGGGWMVRVERNR